ncbi:MAG: flagellin [Lachnospiraceae bacterium]|nr:flagellin [Lachnospiraceae bacterium]
MRINTNITALTACRNLTVSERKSSQSIERLSSGYKINSSKDNPVGAALSTKMKSQLKNLDKAAQSTQDGISVIETAESVLSETQSMVQRIRELCVQAANDTYTDKDRESIMAEIDQLKTEIDRVSEDTDFNTKKLLNGDLGRKSFTNIAGVDATYISTEVDAGEYELHIMNQATQASYTSGNVSSGVSGSVKINGVSVDIEETDSIDEIYTKMRDAADKTGVEVSREGDTFTYTSKRYGSKYGVVIECSNTDIQSSLGLGTGKIQEYGTDIEVELVSGTNSKFSPNATAACDGNKIVITDNDGFKLRIDVEGETDGDRIILHVTDIGAMTVQVGANAGQDMDIDIPRVDCRMMELDDILAYTSGGAGEALGICDAAIEYISEIRSRIGAYQNRMEHTQSSLDATTENMTSALSRITDVDMAEEMTTYTTQSVISQAATSMLAQANEMPDKVLQLLQ